MTNDKAATPITDEELLIAKTYGHQSPFTASLIARIEALQSEITALKTAPELVGQLADELERTRSGFPSEYEIYKCLIDSARSALSAQEPKVCEWTKLPDFGYKSCDETWTIIPSGFKFCPHCSGVIKVKES